MCHYRPVDHFMVELCKVALTLSKWDDLVRIWKNYSGFELAIKFRIHNTRFDVCTVLCILFIVTLPLALTHWGTVSTTSGKSINLPDLPPRSPTAEITLTLLPQSNDWYRGTIELFSRDENLFFFNMAKGLSKNSSFLTEKSGFGQNFFGCTFY